MQSLFKKIDWVLAMGIAAIIIPIFVVYLLLFHVQW
jgi:hypothetical protein